MERPGAGRPSPWLGPAPEASPAVSMATAARSSTRFGGTPRCTTLTRTADASRQLRLATGSAEWRLGGLARVRLGVHAGRIPRWEGGQKWPRRVRGGWSRRRPAWLRPGWRCEQRRPPGLLDRHGCIGTGWPCLTAARPRYANQATRLP